MRLIPPVLHPALRAAPRPGRDHHQPLLIPLRLDHLLANPCHSLPRLLPSARCFALAAPLQAPRCFSIPLPGNPFPRHSLPWLRFSLPCGPTPRHLRSKPRCAAACPCYAIPTRCLPPHCFSLAMLFTLCLCPSARFASMLFYCAPIQFVSSPRLFISPPCRCRSCLSAHSLVFRRLASAFRLS